MFDKAAVQCIECASFARVNHERFRGQQLFNFSIKLLPKKIGLHASVRCCHRLQQYRLAPTYAVQYVAAQCARHIARSAFKAVEMTQWLVARPLVWPRRVAVNSSETRPAASHKALPQPERGSPCHRCHLEKKEWSVFARRSRSTAMRSKDLEIRLYQILEAIRLYQGASPRYQCIKKGDSRRFALIKTAEAIRLAINVIIREI